MPEKTLGEKNPILFGKQNIFKGIGQALTAASLGFQGQDPSKAFDDVTPNLSQQLLAAQIAQIADPEGQTAQVIAQNALGVGPRLKSETVKTPLGKQTFEFNEDPKVKGKREGIEAGIQGSLKDSFEKGNKLIGNIKKLNTVMEQFNKAVPAEDINPALQRVRGFLLGVGADTGLIPNPELKGLRQNARPLAIQIIKGFGEVGNLSETEQQAAIDLVEQTGLTNDERAAGVKQFLEVALTSMDKEVRDHVLQDESTLGILQGLSIDTDLFTAKENNTVNIEDIFKGTVIDGR